MFNKTDYYLAVYVDDSYQGGKIICKLLDKKKYWLINDFRKKESLRLYEIEELADEQVENVFSDALLKLEQKKVAEEREKAKQQLKQLRKKYPDLFEEK